MQLIIISQLLVAIFVALAMGIFGSWSYVMAVIYGSLLGVMITLLTRRSTDRALLAAVENPTHGVVAMFSGLAQRYAVAILGLLAGFKVLQLQAESMIASFVLMIIIQALAMILFRPQNDSKREA